MEETRKQETFQAVASVWNKMATFFQFPLAGLFYRRMLREQL